ncbi:hypothetical protein RB213_004042 [Colletotrichum asianum]
MRCPTHRHPVKCPIRSRDCNRSTEDVRKREPWALPCGGSPRVALCPLFPSCSPSPITQSYCSLRPSYERAHNVIGETCSGRNTRLARPPAAPVE